LELTSRTDLSHDLSERLSIGKVTRQTESIILPSTDNKKRAPKNLALTNATSWKNSLNNIELSQNPDDCSSTSLINLLTPRSSTFQLSQVSFQFVQAQSNGDQIIDVFSKDPAQSITNRRQPAEHLIG
jgi:hypothetical protein